jgi:hypothetical protein
LKEVVNKSVEKFYEEVKGERILVAINITENNTTKTYYLQHRGDCEGKYVHKDGDPTIPSLGNQTTYFYNRDK